MKFSILRLFVTVLLFLSALAATSVNAQIGRLFTVNHNADTHDANGGNVICADTNEKCTLRAAIKEANATETQEGVNFALPVPAAIDPALGEKRSIGIIPLDNLPAPPIPFPDSESEDVRIIWDK
jgi:CSLREA domain-containing protein